jgi:predicted outer membrane repeat protein
MTVTSSNFTGNTATDMGGAIQNCGILSVVNSTFTNNTANRWGGAIHTISGGVLLLLYFDCD